MANILEKVIGTGVLFPFVVTKNSSGETGVYPVSGTQDLIIHNLNSLIQYELGFRIRQEDFGTRLWECIEEPNIQAQTFIIEQFLKESLFRFENRIIYKGSDVIRDGFKLTINVHYTIKDLNVDDSVSVTYNK